MSVVIYPGRNGGSEDTVATLEISTAARKDLFKPYVVPEPSLCIILCTITLWGTFSALDPLPCSSAPLVDFKLGFFGGVERNLGKHPKTITYDLIWGLITPQGLAGL